MQKVEDERNNEELEGYMMGNQPEEEEEEEEEKVDKLSPKKKGFVYQYTLR